MEKLTRKQKELLQAALAKHSINPKWVRSVGSKWRVLNDEGKPLWPEGKQFSVQLAKRLYKNPWKGDHYTLVIFEDGRTYLSINLGPRACR